VGKIAFVKKIKSYLLCSKASVASLLLLLVAAAAAFAAAAATWTQLIQGC
jgi:hypothetical protein